ncbi:MAG: hypothetical protein NTW71_08425 [Deltaproteobacteria bacterium]|nr:hypothetical protein [Deltaproteobacteria bacterium]
MGKIKDSPTLTGKLKLEDKAALLRKRFQDKPDFTISDVAFVLQEKQSTLHWTLYKLTHGGYISRTGQGLYSFQNRATESIQPILSTLARRILKVLGETGHDFFISGLDILTVFMDHVPETYPVLLFAGKSDADEVAEILSRNKIDVVSYTHIQDYSAIRRMSSVGELVLLIPTQEFTYAAHGLASFEKAFVDLYYEVTRRDYPLSIQELVRIYLNMRRRMSLNTNRIVKIASRRNIQQDIRYIVEHDAVTPAAIKFVDHLRKRNR